ncbi:MAG: metal-sensitive transcriptional regulator [Bdellovibrionota bacterium]|nr:metal-sensitive transcriptional regulator [Bdellovibrionota bacterium]
MSQGTDHKKDIHRLKRIEGQVKGIIKMVENQKYCLDILTQIKAVKSALKSLETQILENHLDHCVKEAFESGSKKERKEKMDEVINLIKKSGKL